MRHLFAQVLLCKDNSLVGRVNEQVVSLEKEVAVLKQLNHPNIVRYLVSTLSAPSGQLFFLGEGGVDE